MLSEYLQRFADGVAVIAVDNFCGRNLQMCTRMWLVRAARACSVCRVVFSRLRRRKTRYSYATRALGSLDIQSRVNLGYM